MSVFHAYLLFNSLLLVIHNVISMSFLGTTRFLLLLSLNLKIQIIKIQTINSLRSLFLYTYTSTICHQLLHQNHHHHRHRHHLHLHLHLMMIITNMMITNMAMINMVMTNTMMTSMKMTNTTIIQTSCVEWTIFTLNIEKNYMAKEKIIYKIDCECFSKNHLVSKWKHFNYMQK